MYIIMWRDEALDLLDKRDRFTRLEVRKEFKQVATDPYNHGIEIDPATRLFATSICNQRYTLVWNLDESNKTIIVQAFVACPFSDKEQITAAILSESNGTIRLF